MRKHASRAPEAEPFDLVAALKAHGCHQADGGVEHALRAFQARHGLPRTGRFDARTEAALRAAH